MPVLDTKISRSPREQGQWRLPPLKMMPLGDQFSSLALVGPGKTSQNTLSDLRHLRIRCDVWLPKSKSKIVYKPQSQC